MTQLGVWKAATLIGRLSQTRSGLRFAFDRSLIDQVGLGRPIISMSLLTSARGYADRASRPFFDGLLPEGEARRIIAYDFGLTESDTFGILRAIGRDCAGALSILPDAEQPASPQPTASLPALTTEDLDGLIANLRFHPLGVDETVRASLGGVQEKLLLTSRSDGSWSLPTTGVASTHIFKPSIAGLADSVANEALCLRFADLVGVRSASAQTARFGGRDVLVVERFDRHVDHSGCIVRSHQESACQALAVPVSANARKYEADGGPNLARIAQLLTRWAGESALIELLQQTTVNALAGNADAHAMNTSFLLRDDGTVSLSPLYDVFSTVAYPQLSTVPGMFVNGRRDIRSIGPADLVAEAMTWGIAETPAKETVGRLLQAAPNALDEAVRDQAPPRYLAELLRHRVETFAAR